MKFQFSESDDVCEHIGAIFMETFHQKVIPTCMFRVLLSCITSFASNIKMMATRTFLLSSTHMDG
jgi:hypothetical protein